MIHANTKMSISTIKDWYMSNFHTDGLGNNINPKATFDGLKYNLSRVYAYLGVGDSVVRERVFTELASRMNVDYSVVYDWWLVVNGK